MQNALVSLEKSTESLSGLIKNSDSTKSNYEGLNKKLYQSEQQLLLQNGLPRKNWYKHAIYAPGFYICYGVKTIRVFKVFAIKMISG